MGLHDLDVLLNCFLSAWELPQQSLKITGVEFLQLDDGSRGAPISGKNAYERQVDEYTKADAAA